MAYVKDAAALIEIRKKTPEYEPPEFDVEEDRCERDILVLLEELLDRSLISIHGQP